MSELPSVFEYDFDINEAEAPAPLPTGDYPAAVVMATVGISKNSGNQTLKLDYHVSADEYPVDYKDGNPDGAKLSRWVVIDPKVLNTDAGARFRLKQDAQAHGVSIGRRLNAPDFMGAEVIITVAPDEFNGMPTARITAVRSA